jgi:hypothetical protein
MHHVLKEHKILYGSKALKVEILVDNDMNGIRCKEKAGFVQ